MSTILMQLVNATSNSVTFFDMSLLIQREKNGSCVFSNFLMWLGWFEVSLLSVGAVPSSSRSPHLCVALLLAWMLYSFDLSVI